MSLFKVPLNTWREAKFKKFKAEHNEYEMTIEEDLPEIGSVVYISINGEPRYDYLQDSIKM